MIAKPKQTSRKRKKKKKLLSDSEDSTDEVLFCPACMYGLRFQTQPFEFITLFQNLSHDTTPSTPRKKRRKLELRTTELESDCEELSQDFLIKKRPRKGQTKSAFTIIYKGYAYNKAKVNKNDTLWYCNERGGKFKCKATLWTVGDIESDHFRISRTSFSENTKQSKRKMHNHKQKYSVLRQRMIQKMINTLGVDTTSRDVFWKTLLANPLAAKEFKSFKEVKALLNWHRRLAKPSLPKTVYNVERWIRETEGVKDNCFSNLINGDRRSTTPGETVSTMDDNERDNESENETDADIPEEYLGQFFLGSNSGISKTHFVFASRKALQILHGCASRVNILSFL